MFKSEKYGAVVIIVFGVLAFGGDGFAQPSRSDPEAATGEVAKTQVQAERYMISVANPLAAEAGYEILKNGGSAVDAAIAAQLVLNLVEPQSSGIGGGGFLVYYDAEMDAVVTLDGRETAPMAASPVLFMDKKGEFIGWRNVFAGGRSTGVPGLVRLMGEAHDRYGRMPWAELFDPAIALSENGFEVSPRLASLLERSTRGLVAFPDTAAYFFKDEETPLVQGDVLKNPDFAATLKSIASGGPDIFYRGPIADDIIARIDKAIKGSKHPKYGGMSRDDFASFKVIERDPVCGPYRGYRVCGMAPPSSGGVTLLQILGMLEAYDLRSLGPDSAEAVHLIAEAMRRAYADRGLYLADPAFVDVPVGGLTDATYLAGRGATIDPGKVVAQAVQAGRPAALESFEYAPPAASGRGRSTTHLSVVDAQGNAVSLTTSIETAFGSRLMSSGFLLNNQLTDFAFFPENEGKPVANAPDGGKRPLSSMSPTLVFDPEGNLDMVIGSPGGTRIIAFVAKTIIAKIDWEMDIQEAIAFPHIINQNGPTDIEDKLPLSGLVEALEVMGHEVRVMPMASGLHGIVVTDTGLLGGADPRREGIVLGD